MNEDKSKSCSPDKSQPAIAGPKGASEMMTINPALRNAAGEQHQTEIGKDIPPDSASKDVKEAIGETSSKGRATPKLRPAQGSLQDSMARTNHQPTPSPRVVRLKSQITNLQNQIVSTQGNINDTIAQLIKNQSGGADRRAADNETNITHELSDEERDKALSEAELVVKRHIRLLHDYNEIRDIGMGLCGVIADARLVILNSFRDFRDRDLSCVLPMHLEYSSDYRAAQIGQCHNDRVHQQRQDHSDLRQSPKMQRVIHRWHPVTGRRTLTPCFLQRGKIANRTRRVRHDWKRLRSNDSITIKRNEMLRPIVNNPHSPPIRVTARRPNVPGISFPFEHKIPGQPNPPHSTNTQPHTSHHEIRNPFDKKEETPCQQPEISTACSRTDKFAKSASTRSVGIPCLYPLHESLVRLS